MEWITISTFFIGFSTAFFAISAIYILALRKNRTRYQTVIGIIMAVWALWNLKDLIISFPGMYRQDVLDWILIIDGWSALTYMVFIQETTQPGWTNWRRMIIYSAPFALFTLVYLFWPSRSIIYGYMGFLWFFGWTIIIVAFVRARRYSRFIHANYSNTDNSEITWINPVMAFAVMSQLSWFFTSMISQVFVDIIYYISTLLLWLLVLYNTGNFRPVTMEKEEPLQLPTREYPFEGLLERIVEEQRMYLKKDLTITELARAVDSNRTYVSNYLSQVKGVSFYDYINSLRIECQSIPLMMEHPEYTLEYVANESGFSSISTFRRAFVKKTGKTPSQYYSESTR